VEAPIRRTVPEEPSGHAGMREIPQLPPTTDTDLAYVRLLWNHRRMLLRVVLYALLASTVIAFLIPKRYESTTRLMPPDRESSSGLTMAAAALSQSTSGLGMLAGEFLGLNSNSDLTVGILRSRTLQDKLITQFGLQSVYGVRRMEDARKILEDETKVVIDRKSQIVTITVTDRSPQRAAALAKSYSEELNHLLAELNTSAAHRERVFLEDRLQAVSKDLEAAEQDFSQFASKNTAIDIKEQGRAMVTAAATLQGQLIAVQSEYEGLRQIYADSNVRIRALKARIEEIQRQLDKVGGKGEDSSISASAGQDELYPSIRRLPLLGVSYADLYRRTKIQEAVLETLTKEYELAKVEEAKELPTVKVLDAANIPERKSFPPRILMILLGTVFAFSVATVWIFCHAIWIETDPGDPRKIFAQEVLATISARLPHFSRNGSGRQPA
jgi:capsule polysaccharide export protein KpsE/RkpR